MQEYACDFCIMHAERDTDYFLECVTSLLVVQRWLQYSSVIKSVWAVKAEMFYLLFGRAGSGLFGGGPGQGGYFDPAGIVAKFVFKNICVVGSSDGPLELSLRKLFRR